MSPLIRAIWIIIVTTLAGSLTLPAGALAEDLVLPIIEQANDDLDTCALAEIHGLKPGGDGFLAVRAAPGTSYEQLDDLKNGDRVWVFQQIGDWLGIVYGSNTIACGPIAADRPAPFAGKKGWVHQNWVRIIAG